MDGKAGGQDDSAERFRYELDELLAISRALSSERDIKALLTLILSKSRLVTGADAGSVYVVEDDPDEPSSTGFRPGTERAPRKKRLHFMLLQNDSLKIDVQEFTLPVDAESIVGKAALDRRPINIPDLDALAQPGGNPWSVRHNRTLDDRTGYRSRSMLTVPMLSAHNEVIGVIQLINKRRAPADIVPFDERSEQLALALASQAGICLENATLYDEIKKLFEGFVDASVSAIESRDPTTSGHSRRVATLSVALAERVDEIPSGPLQYARFSRDDLRQLEYAGVLHDFGKVGVRENVLVKAKKLHDPQLVAIESRFRYIRKALEADSLRRQLELVSARGRAALTELAALQRAAEIQMAEVDECLRCVYEANEPALLVAPVIERLSRMARMEFVDLDGTVRPYLTNDELTALQIPRGSLTVAERKEIERHVSHTIAFLEMIPWSRNLRRIPRIAGGHHESLNGQGYPHGLKGDEICIESRILTIADIFDALTASDRPYKLAVPTHRALDIIGGEVKNGRCDPLLFEVFVQAEVYKKVL